MAHPDTYGPELEKELRRATKGKGVTIGTLCEKVGCTEGRVRQWMRANGHRLQVVGKTETGARLFKLDLSAPAHVIRILPQVRVGESLKVLRIKETHADRVVLELRDSHGKHIEASVSGMAVMGVAS